MNVIKAKTCIPSGSDWIETVFTAELSQFYLRVLHRFCHKPNLYVIR